MANLFATSFLCEQAGLLRRACQCRRLCRVVDSVGVVADVQRCRFSSACGSCRRRKRHSQRTALARRQRRPAVAAHAELGPVRAADRHIPNGERRQPRGLPLAGIQRLLCAWAADGIIQPERSAILVENIPGLIATGVDSPPSD